MSTRDLYTLHPDNMTFADVREFCSHEIRENLRLAARGESRRPTLNSVHHPSRLIGEVREDCHGDGATETGASGDVLGSDQ